MAQRGKSRVSESFAQGFGGELGKKAAVGLITIIVIIVMLLLGFAGNDDSTTETDDPIKLQGSNGNVQ